MIERLPDEDQFQLAKVMNVNTENVLDEEMIINIAIGFALISF